jgi:hypothetical protein
MTTVTTPSFSAEAVAQEVATPQPPCEGCQGSGGWFRYEPAMDPGPGLLYLSCVQCSGGGRLALPRG